MNYFVIGLIIAVFILGWVGIGLYTGVGSKQSESGHHGDPDEWPVIARSNNEQEIYVLESTLESEGFEVMTETENPNSLQGAISAVRNQIRVRPSEESEAKETLRESGNDKLLID